jgi:ribose transport system permease protein
VTLAMLGIAQGFGLLLTNGRPVSGFPEAYSYIGQGRIGPVAVPIIIALVVYAAIHVLLTRTKFGIEVYATGGGRRAAEMAGIRVNRVIIKTFVISGFCGAIAGVILSSRLDAGNGNFGATNLLDAVAAAVVGGTSLMGGAGSVLGTLGGILIISVIRNGLVLLNVQAFWQDVAVGAIIVFAVVVNKIVRGELSLSSLTQALNR